MAGVIGEYGEFFGPVARQVSEPVDFVMTVKEMAEGSITPEEAAINLATMGHGHLAESVERTAVQAVEKGAVGAAKQKAAQGAGSSTSEASATGSSRPPDPEGHRPPPEAKPRSVTRQDIMREVERAMPPHIETIRSLDPQAQIGYRGSLASGKRSVKKKFGPFDPKDFDVDAFIISDKIAPSITPRKLRFRKKNAIPWRSGTDHAIIDKIQVKLIIDFELILYSLE